MANPQPLSSQPVLSTRQMTCLTCATPLSGFTWNGVAVDVCKKGCGIWFDYGEMVEIEQSDTLENIDHAFAGTFESKPVKEALDAPPRACPRDGKTLDRFEWNPGSAIVIDVCPDCLGTWLDNGELEGYVAYVKSFRAHPPEISPELKAKLDHIQLQTDQEYEAMLDDSTKRVVRWDLGPLDDMLRGLMKTIMRISD